jgi:hypothetical protein
VRDDFGFQHLWHWCVISADDDTEPQAWLAQVRAPLHDFEPEVRTEFTVRERPDQLFEISDGPDVFAAGVMGTAVLDLIIGRLSCRALELASRKGWLCLRGIVSREGERSALCVSASPGLPGPVQMILVKDGVIMEVPGLHPVRPGAVVVSVGPRGRVAPEDPVAVVRVAAADEVRIEPMSSLEAVQALLAQGIELTELPADRIRAAATLVRSAPCYAVWALTWPQLPAAVWECL